MAFENKSLSRVRGGRREGPRFPPFSCYETRTRRKTTTRTTSIRQVARALVLDLSTSRRHVVSRLSGQNAGSQWANILTNGGASELVMVKRAGLRLVLKAETDRPSGPRGFSYPALLSQGEPQHRSILYISHKEVRHSAGGVGEGGGSWGGKHKSDR